MTMVLFHKDLSITCHLFASCSPKSGMARHRWGLRSWFDTAPSLIGPIWRALNAHMSPNSFSVAQDLSVVSNVPSSCQLHPKKWHDQAQMGTQELVRHCIITHWTHMEDMKCFSAASYSVKFLQTVWCCSRFVSNLPSFCQLQPKKWHDQAQMGTQKLV
jgi:hypothetical protein